VEGSGQKNEIRPSKEGRYIESLQIDPGCSAVKPKKRRQPFTEKRSRDFMLGI
jgi:hypothetical protein